MEDWKHSLSLPSEGLSLSLDGDTVRLEGGNLDELDYWEIDPAWDGLVFHSAAQATRPLRNGGVPATLKLPVEPGMLCGRVVDCGGKISELRPAA
jgi:hypothetical protein